MALLIVLSVASPGLGRDHPVGRDQLILVTAEGEGALMIATPSVLSPLPFGKAPHNLVLSPDGTRAWVTVGEIRNTVILFDFGREVLGAFHVQNVPAALDIAFVKASGRIFSILRMDPSPTAPYGPMSAYRYAVEARAGFFKELGIAPGDSVQLERTK